MHGNQHYGVNDPVNVKDFSLDRSTGRKSSAGSTSSNDDFSVHTGPAHLDAPLGHSTTHDHYIKPVPPTYVTEYESAFTWPTPTPPFKRVKSGLNPVTPTRDDSTDTEIDRSPWNDMLSSLKGLESTGYHHPSLGPAVMNVNERLLDQSTEIIYQHLRTQMEERKVPHKMERAVGHFLKSVERVKWMSVLDNVTKYG